MSQAVALGDELNGILNERRAKWIALSFAFTATVINYIDRQTLSVLAPVILERYHISAESYSQIIFAFMLAYTISNGVSGRFLDWLGTKVGYAVIIAVWSGAEMLHAVARGAPSFGVCRFLLGVGEAGNYPAGVKLISEHFSAEQRSMAGGLFNSGASIGAILAPPLLAFLSLRLGANWSFILVGLSGFIWLIAWLLLYRPSASAKRENGNFVPIKQLMGSRFLWQFTLSKVFSDPVWYFYTFWFPQYLHTDFHFNLRQIGETAWIPFFTGAIGNVVGGTTFSAIYRSAKMSGFAARRACIIGFSSLMMAALFIPLVRSSTEAISLISLATFGYSGALANLLALPADAFPERSTASVWGIASMGSGLGGMLFSLATGWLISRFSFQSAFLLFGALPILSSLLIWKLPHSAGLISGDQPDELSS